MDGLNENIIIMESFALLEGLYDNAQPCRKRVRLSGRLEKNEEILAQLRPLLELNERIKDER